MRKVLLISLLLIAVLVLATGLTGCGSSTVTPKVSSQFASLRFDAVVTDVRLSHQQRMAARREAKIAHMTRRQADMIIDKGYADIYIWSSPTLGADRKVTDPAAEYVSAFLSADGVHGVFSAKVNGYEQIFMGTVPTTQQTVVEPVQITGLSGADATVDHHAPQMSANGEQIVFSKGDSEAICTMAASAGAEQKCLNFSGTQLAEAWVYGGTWTPSGKIIFEGWGYGFDELFMVDPAATPVTLTQISDNANETSSHNYTEVPSVSPDGTKMVAESDNGDIVLYDLTLTTKQVGKTILNAADSDTDIDSWDPLFVNNTQIVFLSERENDKNTQLYVMKADGTDAPGTNITNNLYENFFDDWW